MSASEEPIVRLPRVKLIFIPGNQFWWKEIGFIPEIGSFVVPFSETRGWAWDHDSVVVVDHVYFFEENLVCVTVRDPALHESEVELGNDFFDAMENAGWKFGDDGAWS